jgi:phage host-nuclease inhibitor protein Gam
VAARRASASAHERVESILEAASKNRIAAIETDYATRIAALERELVTVKRSLHPPPADDRLEDAARAAGEITSGAVGLAGCRSWR